MNAAHSGIKLYLAEVSRGGDETDSNRSMDLAGFAINLERAGDIIKGLLDMALDKKKKSHNFSPEGWRELTGLHDRLMANMQLSLNVLLSEDLDSARQLIMEKDRMRTLETAEPEEPFATPAKRLGREHRDQRPASRDRSQPARDQHAFRRGRIPDPVAQRSTSRKPPDFSAVALTGASLRGKAWHP